MHANAIAILNHVWDVLAHQLDKEFFIAKGPSDTNPQILFLDLC
jgi:hypothetical protein